MEYGTLDQFVRTLGKTQRRGQFTQFILDRLESTTGPVILISGEMHPGSYRKPEIGRALHEVIRKGKQSVTLCWGPTTYLMAGARHQNSLFTEGVLKSLDAPNLSILHSRYRQDTHLWVFGDCIAYQPPHRPGAGSSEKETVWSKAAHGIHRFVWRDLQHQMRQAAVVRVNKTPQALSRAFRTVEIELDEDNGVARYAHPVDPKEAVAFFVSFAKSIPAVSAIRWSGAEKRVFITTYLAHRDSRCVVTERLADYATWTMDRFPELHLDFLTLLSSRDRIRGLRSDQGTIYLRR